MNGEELLELAGGRTVHLTGVRQAGKSTALIRYALMSAAFLDERISYHCATDVMRTETYRKMYDLINQYRFPLQQAIAVPSSQMGFTFRGGGYIDLFIPRGGYGSGHHRSKFVEYDVALGDEGVATGNAKFKLRAHEA
jgi:hypothetical protein